MPQSPLDPQAVALSKAIRQTESGGNFNAKGQSGEWGGYQWIPDTFKKHASEAGVNAQFGSASPEQQNEIAYKVIKKWKDQGYNPGQIASMWNAGPGKPNAYVEGNKGVNSANVGYDTKDYATRVATEYQRFKREIPGSMGGTPQQQNPSLLGDIGQTLGRAGTRLSSAIGQTASGQINPLSGLIQSAGAIAGGIGGVGMNVLEHTPLVGQSIKGLEMAAGDVAGKFAQTQTGQNAVGRLQEFNQKHPELSADIAAGVDVAGLVGGGFGGKVAKDIAVTGAKQAATKGLVGGIAKNFAEKSASKTATKLLSESGPTLNEVRSAIKGGRTGGGSIGADPLRTESVQHVTDLVKSGDITKKMAPTDAANRIKKAADAEAESMRSQLRAQEIQKTLQPEELNAMAANVQKRAGDALTTGEKPADNLLKVFHDALPKGADITAEDILNARQAVSKYVLDNRGDWNMRGVMTGFKNARDAIWDESRTLLADMAPDVPIRASLKKQSALYRSLDYIAPAVKKEITKQGKPGLVSRVARKGLKYAVEGAGMGGVLHLLGE